MAELGNVLALGYWPAYMCIAALADVHSWSLTEPRRKLEPFDMMSRAAYRVVKKSRASRPAGRRLELPNLACAVAGKSPPIRSYL